MHIILLCNHVTHIVFEASQSNMLKFHLFIWLFQCLMQAVTKLSPQRPRFGVSSVHVQFVVNKVALGHVFF